MAPRLLRAASDMGNATSLPRTNEIPPAPVSDTRAVGEAPPDSGTVSAHPALDGDWPTLAVLSRRYIDRALDHTRGNKTRAADLLGIDRRTLNRILARERAKAAAAARFARPPVSTTPAAKTPTLAPAPATAVRATAT